MVNFSRTGLVVCNTGRKIGRPTSLPSATDALVKATSHQVSDPNVPGNLIRAKSQRRTSRTRSSRVIYQLWMDQVRPQYLDSLFETRLTTPPLCFCMRPHWGLQAFLSQPMVGRAG